MRKNLVINKSLEDCVDFIREQNTQMKRSIGNLVISFLDSQKSRKDDKPTCDNNDVMHKEMFLHDINRQTAFRIEEGRWWHPEFYIICITKGYVGEEETYTLFKVPNVRGCLWIEFEEKDAAYKIAQQMKDINAENVIQIKNVPSQLKDLINEIESEKRSCGHKNPL